MTQAKGSATQLILGFEATFGTDATAGFVMPFNTSGLNQSRNIITPATITGNRNPSEPFQGNKIVEGPIVVPLDSDAYWYWLKAMFGDPSTSGTGPYVHEFKVPTSQSPLTIEHQFTDITQYAKYNGCKISGWSMELGGDGELVSTFEIIGQKETFSGSAFDASPTSLTLRRLKNFQATLEEGGASFATATAVSFNVNMGLDRDQYSIAGGGEVGDLPEGNIEITGNLTALFEDLTLLNKAKNATESSLEIIVTIDANYKISILFPEIQYGENSPEINTPGGIVVDLPFNAYYTDASEATSLEVNLTNQDAHA
jgi:hypothetical protein